MTRLLDKTQHPATLQPFDEFVDLFVFLSEILLASVHTINGPTPDQIKVIIQEESVKIENGSYTAASPAVASLAAASALMDDPNAARLKLGNLVKEIIAVQATVTKLKGAGEQATRGLEEARKLMAHAELMVQKSLEALKDIGDALERANTIAGELKVVHTRMADNMSSSARTSAPS
ncbi:hypothetical protein D6C99_06787 [Aureobasidium pullulans]|nr:hypothetical protein D6C99_06787 [Aureobasidium pullulans]